MSITLKRLRQRAFLKTSLEEQQGRAGSGVPLRRCLGYGSQPQESVLTPSTLLVLVCWKWLEFAGPLTFCCLGLEAPSAQGCLFSPGSQLQSMQGELL